MRLKAIAASLFTLCFVIANAISVHGREVEYIVAASEIR
jgi:hypothetical protein